MPTLTDVLLSCPVVDKTVSHLMVADVRSVLALPVPVPQVYLYKLYILRQYSNLQTRKFKLEWCMTCAKLRAIYCSSLA